MTQLHSPLSTAGPHRSRPDVTTNAPPADRDDETGRPAGAPGVAEPAILRAQALVPRLVEAQRQITGAVLHTEGALPRRVKELVCLAIAARRGSRYAMAAHGDVLRRMHGGRDVPEWIAPRSLTAEDQAVMRLAMKVAGGSSSITTADFAEMRGLGLTDTHVLETVVTAGFGLFECSVATGLGVEPDVDVPHVPPLAALLDDALPPGDSGHRTPLPVASGPEADALPPLAFLREVFGFTPNVFRILMLRPDIAEAAVAGIRQVLLPGEHLSRTQKEHVFLVISARNLNTYCVAAHCELLRGLGMSVEDSDQIAVDHHQADLGGRDKALLDFVLALAFQPGAFGCERRAALGALGFSDEQVLEAIVMTGFSHFVNAATMGLVAEPDFALPPAFAAVARRQGVPLLARDVRPAAQVEAPDAASDPDLAAVTRVQSGERDAFEELVRRHGRRVHLTLGGILRNDDDIEDAVQETFVKAFQHIGSFQGRSTFLTWLTRIAINAGLQRLRARRDVESLDLQDDGDDDVQPRQVRAWQDNPEQAYARAVTRDLVWKAVGGLPLKYRLVVVLRDLEQFSTAETAAALDLGVPAVKARLFRARLMLREALAPHFTRRESAAVSS
ncbi:MAG: peroxidase-related enzyme [Vicinamibacterales bacterium]